MGKLEMNTLSKAKAELHHDDEVNVRVVSTLVGVGIVLAEECSQTRPIHHQTCTGDIVLLKGGKSGASKPCLYRAPHAEEDEVEQFVITVDRIAAEQRERLVGMKDEDKLP